MANSAKSPIFLGVAVVLKEPHPSKKGFSISRHFPKGSVLFVCIGSTIGKCGIASETLTSNQQINAILPSAALSSDYLYYAVSAIAPKVKSLAGEQAVPIVNKTQFSETSIPLPPTKTEQKAIAEVLSGADALIESFEQLVVAKTEFKCGLMQQLLTGRKRFREFKGQEWKQFHLGDVAIESELRNNGSLTEKSLYAVTKAYGMIPMRERVQGESVERCKVVSKDWFAYNPMRLNIAPSQSGIKKMMYWSALITLFLNAMKLDLTRIF